MPSSGPQPVIRFGAFELDAASGELRKAGIPIKLQPQPFRVLTLLAERAGHVVGREEIQHVLWDGDTFVNFDRSINFCINQIRAALNDNPEKPRYIETIPRRGYRFRRERVREPPGDEAARLARPLQESSRRRADLDRGACRRRRSLFRGVAAARS
jgi:DNA-binding winged helix-turn-helix (wHTH) protein